MTAATEVGGEDGLVGYLRKLAVDEPVAFAGLLGKVLPLTVAGDANAPLRTISTIGLVAPGERSATPNRAKASSASADASELFH